MAAALAAGVRVASARSAGEALAAPLLMRIKRHVRDGVARQTDYTCLQTTQRYRRAKARAALKPFDTVRLEGGKEMYAPPGAHQFEHYSAAIFAGTGLSGTGVYSPQFASE